MYFRLALLLLSVLGTQTGYAQNSLYNIVNYTTDNGLPQNSITGIQFDRKGYCWLGTQMGLVRFDGQRFCLFGSDKIKGMRSDRILNVTRDTAGTIFISTAGIVHTLRINDSSLISAPEPVLLTHSATGIPQRGFPTPGIACDTRPGDPFQKTLGTAAGNLYTIDSNKGYYITLSSKKPFLLKEAYLSEQMLLIDEHLVVLQAYNKVAVWDSGVAQPGPKLCGPLWSNPDFIRGHFGTPSSITGTYVYAGNNLYQLSLSHDTLYSETVLADISIPAMSRVYVNKAGNTFYIGSGVSGLFIIKKTDFYTPPTPGPAINSDFYSQSVMQEGIFSQNFLFRKDGSSKEYPLIRHLKATWYRRETRSIFYAPNLALLRFDLATAKTHTICALASPLSFLLPDPSQQDGLLFGTDFSIGKIRQDTLLEEKTIQGLKKEQQLLAVYPAGTDTFLLATWSGVKWYDYRHNRIYRSVLDSLTVRQLYIESPRRIWIATYGKGWYLYDTGRITRMPDGPLKALKTVNAIIDDRQGHFWLSSNNGLYKVSKQALLDYAEQRSEAVYFYAFSTKDKLPTNEFNAANPSYVWLPDSMLSLPTIKGLVWFYPYKLTVSLPDKGIYLEHIDINETAIQAEGGRLKLAPDHGRLRLIVSSPYFGNKENMQLQFRIAGLDTAWQDVSEHGDIIIDRIPAGTYTLEVRKFTGMEPGQYTRLRLPVQVLPYWYRTNLFYLSLVFLSVILVYRLIKLRTRLLLARNRKLKTQVALQTRDLNRMVHQLTRSEEALKDSNQTKDNIITTVLHDLRSPLRFIYTISKHVAGNHRKMEQDTLEGHLQELQNSTASLNSFTDQFFTWAVSQHRSFAARYSRQALAGIFRDIESLYADIMSANGNRLIVMPTGLHCYTDPQLLSAVVRNLLDNANKNTRNGIIKLAADQVGEELIITIGDTGKGFTAEALHTFLNKDKTGSSGGQGSFIILYLLELIGGSLEAVSKQEEGTVFSITLSRQHSDHYNKPNG